MPAPRAISLRELQQVYTRDELMRLVARRGTAGTAEFLSALQSDLDDAIRGLEDAADHYAADGPEKLTHFLASHLCTLGYKASCAMHAGAYAELKIESSSANVTWLAVTVLHGAPEQSVEGIVQLLGRISGRQEHAGFVLYIRERGAAQILENWINALKGDDRVGLHALTPSESCCVFTSRHRHSSGFLIAVRHCAVLLNHAGDHRERRRTVSSAGKRTILFLAADPDGADQREIEKEARAIQTEMDLSGYQGRFEFVTRWAVESTDLLRELRRLKPSLVHFSGCHSEPPHRRSGGFGQHSGLFLHGPDGHPQLISVQALEETFGAAGSSVETVILSGCYAEAQADALLTHVEHVVGMSPAVSVDAIRAFARGFYGGIGGGEKTPAAFDQGCAAISLHGVAAGELPLLRTRASVSGNIDRAAHLAPSR